MLNKLQRFVECYNMLQPGDAVVCAVSGGADSVALLFAMYLLQSKWNLSVSAAHFNHHLRGVESDRDEEFVRQLCDRLDIKLYVGHGQITAGKKGLEAAAREGRYAFLKTLPGKIATAHTADDNAETLLMHIIRGTGLKGLGAIAPINGCLIRPMLEVTRQDVMEFLEEYHLSYVTDSSNETDQFMRNRLRHHIMPLLAQENPKIAENMSSLALRLRRDEEALESAWDTSALPEVSVLRQMQCGVRCRYLEAFLKRCGIREPEAAHILLLEKLVFSDKPSASAKFPNGVTVSRRYDTLVQEKCNNVLQTVTLTCPGTTHIPGTNLKAICTEFAELTDSAFAFSFVPEGAVVVRSRAAGDKMRLYGGTRELKKVFIDKKIPAAERASIPVVSDERGVVGVYGIGVNRDRLASGAEAVCICFEEI